MTKLGHVVPHVFDEQLLFERPGIFLVFLSDLNIVMITIATVVVTVMVTSTESAVECQCTGVEGGHGFRERGGAVGGRGPRPSAYHAQESEGGRGAEIQLCWGHIPKPQCLPLLCLEGASFSC